MSMNNSGLNGKSLSWCPGLLHECIQFDAGNQAAYVYMVDMGAQ